MARDPHEAVDFAPAWLNFNNSNKKKPEKNSGIHSSSLASTFSLSSPLKPPQDPPFPFRTNSLGLRSGGSPSRSSNTSFWNHHSPSTRPPTRHLSVDFCPSYLNSKNDNPTSPNRTEFKGHSRPLAFSPTLASAKSSSLTWTKNGPTPLHHGSGSGSSSPGLDTDFPSLSDVDSSEQNKPQNSMGQTPSGTVVNMWQKPLVLKNNEQQQSMCPKESNTSSLTSSIYKTLVPRTSSSNQKPYRRTMSVPLVFPLKSANSIGELTTSGSKRNAPQPNSPKFLTGNTSNLRMAKSELQHSVNAAVMSGHKKHKKGKNHFLQTLRQSENEDEPAGGVNFTREKFSDSVLTDGDLTKTPSIDWFHRKGNGEIDMNYKKTALEGTILSSSLEAEHRLLKEMGWKYPDDQTVEEELPLTEDEIREFHIRCNGVLPAVPAKREKASQNAFSGWKFSGIRKRSTDTDSGNNSNNGSLFPQKQENGGTQDNLGQFSSDEDEF